MLKADRINAIARAPLDRNIVKTLEKAGERLDYVSGTIIMDMLTMAFGPTWSVQYPEHWIEQYGTIDTKKGAYTPPYVVIAKAVLSVPMMDPETKQPITVIREGFGTATMKYKFEEMVLKTAQTDALKKAAYSFGLAAELSRKPAEQAWFLNKISPWSTDKLAAYSKEWDIIRNYMKQNNITQTQISHLMLKFSNGEESEITPNNIIPFVDYLTVPAKAS